MLGISFARIGGLFALGYWFKNLWSFLG